MTLPLAGRAATVVTVSDRCARGETEDLTGPQLAQSLTAAGATVAAVIVEDGEASVATALADAVSSGARIVITTGGTGIGPRDKTPEGTARVIATLLPGVSELLRARDAASVPNASLSRGLAGLTSGPRPAVIVNLPGSPAAVGSALEILPRILGHALAQVDGADH